MSGLYVLVISPRLVVEGFYAHKATRAMLGMFALKFSRRVKPSTTISVRGETDGKAQSESNPMQGISWSLRTVQTGVDEVVLEKVI